MGAEPGWLPFALRPSNSFKTRRWPKPPPGVKTMLPPNRKLHDWHMEPWKIWDRNKDSIGQHKPTVFALRAGTAERT